jgi:g-D-glutamyl-meso-diaminopimelate peptidase
MNIIDKVEVFYKNFGEDKGVIGHSVFHKPIYYFAVKKTKLPVLIVQCSMHAREYITAHLCLRLVEEFSRFGKAGTVYFIPLVNPDGVEIALNEKPLYKANGRGVDLNVNFDARWGKGATNSTQKGDENFIGKYPFSEPETRALRDFTLKIQPDATISYHSKGEEIYYEFFQDKERIERDYLIAKIAQEETGYAIKSTPFSCGGYKDWCVKWLKIPALTIEVGSDELSHPIEEKYLEQIFIKNKKVIPQIIKGLVKIKCKKNS